jgi:hypothetical protein
LVAQLVEQCPFKALVEGSSPSQPTISKLPVPSGSAFYDEQENASLDGYLFVGDVSICKPWPILLREYMGFCAIMCQ